MWLSSMERAGSGVREAGLSFLTVLWAADPVSPLCIRAEELNMGLEETGATGHTGRPLSGYPNYFSACKSSRAPAFLSPDPPAFGSWSSVRGQQQRELHSQ